MPRKPVADEGLPAIMRREAPSARHQRLLARLLLAVVASAAFAFALVPFYDMVCRITGLNGRTNDSFSLGGYFGGNGRGGVDRSRTITVEFTGTVMPGLLWEMHPLTDSLTLHPGELHTVKFLVRNHGILRVEGQAVPGVTPGQASRYFSKVDCFCFTHQPMNPGEEREMPVTFVIRSDLDPEVSQITLSYAFFPVAAARRVALPAPSTATTAAPPSRFSGNRSGFRSGSQS